MNIRHAILTATLALAASTAQAKQPQSTAAEPGKAAGAVGKRLSRGGIVPITFARSGKTVMTELQAINYPVKQVVLWAYGRRWTQPTDVKSGARWAAEFAVPAVRVPTVFVIALPDNPDFRLGQIVAYPDRDVQWDKKTTLYAAGAPKWFDQWTEATGLPVKKVNTAEFISCISNVRRARPEGPIDVSRGRKPPVGMLLLIKPRRGERGLFARGSVAPPGLDGLIPLSGGLRPRLISVAPSGLTKTGITEINNPINRRKPKDKDKKHVLIIGREVAGKKFADTLAIAKKHKINVLVLEAAWFGGKSGKVAVQPKQMAGGLAELRRQKWSMPTAFGSHRKPWPGIANRWAWISDTEGLPLVEEIGGPTTSYRRIVLSYIPWQEQLGRRDVADLTLLNVLSAATGKAGELCRVPVIQYPSPKVFKDLTEAQKQRPVLVAALRAALWIDSTDHPPAAYIIDLRGKESPSAEFRKTWKWLETRNDSEAPLLILGDDPMLDDWKWAKINRKKQVSKQTGVVWLPDDTLPPSAKNQIRLMLKLTELGIPMRHPKPLNKGKKDEKPNK